jgi:hypothetical protein
MSRAALQRRLVAFRFLLNTLFFLGTILVLMPKDASALPAFARQTGQNCVSCHAGGQFPELTPYGRMFKMTGYTIGAQALQLAVMGVANYGSVANTSKSASPATDFAKNEAAIFSTGSILIGGKIADNVGLFSQITYDNYAIDNGDGTYNGDTTADNIDLRYADHFFQDKHDLVVGVSLNNNPSITDPWNTAPAWMQYVPVPAPTAYQFADGASVYPGYASGGNIAGVSAYLFLDRTLYVELGTYKTADDLLSVMRLGIAAADATKLQGNENPYWRFAYNHEWGAHTLMIGTSGMIAHVYDAGSTGTDPNDLALYRNTGFDAQYQYLLDPHTITAQVSFMRQETNYSVNALAAASAPANFFLADGVTPVSAPNPTDTTDILRARLSYVYEAKYGGVVGYFSRTGTSNTLNQTSGFDAAGCTSCNANSTAVTGNLAGDPATSGITLEAFWLPMQNVRAGVQYTMFDKFNGASSNYDGFGRDAKDNNTLFAYVWFVF